MNACKCTIRGAQKRPSPIGEMALHSSDIGNINDYGPNRCGSITLLGNLEVLLAAEHHSLEHLMGRNVGLEVSGIPKLPHKLSEPLHQEEHDVPGWPADSLVVLLLQKEVSQRRNVAKSLNRENWL